MRGVLAYSENREVLFAYFLKHRRVLCILSFFILIHFYLIYINILSYIYFRYFLTLSKVNNIIYKIFYLKYLLKIMHTHKNVTHMLAVIIAHPLHPIYSYWNFHTNYSSMYHIYCGLERKTDTNVHKGFSPTIEMQCQLKQKF